MTTGRPGRAGARRRRPISRVLETLVGALLFHRREPTTAMVEDLRREVAALPPIADDSANADPLWIGKRRQLRELLLTRHPRDVLRWDPIRTTMVKRGRRPVAVELAHLRRRADWRPRWRPAVRESTTGRPRPFVRLPSSSTSLLHHAYHACRFEEVTGRALADFPFILEFGGGYGGMCRLVHQLGFRGRYWIFDLPEVSAVQRFFLRAVGIDGVRTWSDPDALRAALADRPAGDAAFVAAWSLGETPVALRRRILPLVETFGGFLIGYTERFADIDNTAFFRGWRAQVPGVAWHDVPLPHLGKPEWYLLGARAAR